MRRERERRERGDHYSRISHGHACKEEEEEVEGGVAEATYQRSGLSLALFHVPFVTTPIRGPSQISRARCVRGHLPAFALHLHTSDLNLFKELFKYDDGSNFH